MFCTKYHSGSTAVSVQRQIKASFLRCVNVSVVSGYRSGFFHIWIKTNLRQRSWGRNRTNVTSSKMPAKCSRDLFIKKKHAVNSRILRIIIIYAKRMYLHGDSVFSWMFKHTSNFSEENFRNKWGSEWGFWLSSQWFSCDRLFSWMSS